MGLFQKTDPEGVDVAIDELQKDLFLGLTTKFGWRDYDSYHRAYRNKKEKDTLPEIYTSKGDYKEVLFNDNETVTSFFLSDEKRAYDSGKFIFSQGVSIIFQANLSKLFPDIIHRADEELIANVIKTIKNKFWDSQLIEVITGVDKVYESLKIANEKHYYDDMSNFSISRFNFKMLYSITNCNTSVLK